MKVTRIAYTDYPIASDKCELRKIHVIYYDGNKYCDVHAYAEDGTLEENILDIKIGYIKMDPELVRSPNKKTVATWEGLDRAPKWRHRKTTFRMQIEMKDGTPAPNQVEQIYSTYKAAIRKASALLQNHTEIQEICIATSVSSSNTYGRRGWSSGDQTFMVLFEGKPNIFWRDRWNRYIGKS